ncbi:hypothetical protein KAH27_03795 [bacterium]|nr:hypothetical protein [bacterium]
MLNEFSKIIIIALCCYCNFLSASFDGIPDSLNRGHRLILKHGFQIQALVFPEFYPSGQSFDTNRWIESKFTTPNTHENASPQLLIPNTQWARWISWKDITGTHGPYLQSWEIPYIPNLVSLQAGDERNIRDTNVVNYFKKTFAIWKTNYPNVINYGNFAGMTWNTDDELRHYLAVTKPDMLVMDFYPFGGDVEGGGAKEWYRTLGRFRAIASGGHDGSGNKPIPYGCYFQTYTLNTNFPISASEITLTQFLPLLYGYKFLTAFFYNQPPSITMFSQLFYSAGDTKPNNNFYQTASNNIQILNIAPVLERLISYGNDVCVVPGCHKSNSGEIVVNNLPDYTTKWNDKIDPFITNIRSTNNSLSNFGLNGDVWIGYFNPLDESFDGPIYSNQLYFMILNGLTESNAVPEEAKQKIRLDFDFGNTGINSLQRINRNTGKIEKIKLKYIVDSKYFTVITLNGGEADLFKFNNGAPFVGSLDAPENIFPADYKQVIIAPAKFFASQFNSPLNYSFAASQWQVSNHKTFKSIIWDSGKTIPVDNFTSPANAIPLGTNFWRGRFQNSIGQWSCWSKATPFVILYLPVNVTKFKDTFDTTTNNKNINFQFNVCRQSGENAPLTYIQKGKGTVECYNGKCKVTSGNQGVLISPKNNFNITGDYFIAAEVIRTKSTNGWFGISFCDSSICQNISESSGLNFILDNSGKYQLRDDKKLISRFSFPELSAKTNKKLKIKFQISKKKNSKYLNISLIINNKPYPAISLSNGSSEFLYRCKNIKKTNFISISISPNSSLLFDDFCIQENK